MTWNFVRNTLKSLKDRTKIFSWKYITKYLLTWEKFPVSWSWKKKKNTKKNMTATSSSVSFSKITCWWFNSICVFSCMNGELLFSWYVKWQFLNRKWYFCNESCSGTHFYLQKANTSQTHSKKKKRSKTTSSLSPLMFSTHIPRGGVCCFIRIGTTCAMCLGSFNPRFN